MSDASGSSTKIPSPSSQAPAETIATTARSRLSRTAWAGHAAGEVASALALEVVRRVYYSLDKIPSEALRAAFDAANRAIFDYAAKHPDCAGMGTTCTALGVRDNLLWLAHVGDSRAIDARRTACPTFRRSDAAMRNWCATA